jgi:hypothetical protein
LYAPRAQDANKQIAVDKRYKGIVDCFTRVSQEQVRERGEPRSWI